MLRLSIFIGLLVVLSATAYADRMVYMHGYNLVSLRSFSDNCGARVGYNNGRRAIAVTLGNRAVYLVPNSYTAWIGDRRVRLGTPPVIVGGLTYVPLGFMVNAFGLRNTWNARQTQCTIYVGNRRVIYDRDYSWGRQRHTMDRHYTPNHYRNFPPPGLRHNPGRGNAYGRRGR